MSKKIGSCSWGPGPDELGSEKPKPTPFMMSLTENAKILN